MIRTHFARIMPLAAALAAVTLAAAACSPGTATTGTGQNRSGGATSSSQSHGASHDARTIPPPAPLRRGERFVDVRVPQPYTPSAPNGGTDEYRCFLIDPRLTSPAFLTGSQFLRQNAGIVHHAIFFRITPADAPAARALDARTPGQGWTCFGDDGVGEDSSWVGHWAPGANETLLAADVGYPMPAGSMLVLQVHYNLLATGGRPGPTDQSGIRLRLAEGSAGLKPLQTVLLPAPVELPCTAGESGPLCDRTAAIADVTHRFGADVGRTEDQLIQHCAGGRPVPGITSRCEHKVPQAATVYAAAGHMHLLGRSISIELNPGAARARTLLDIPAYNFDDQGIRPLASPVRVKAGDTLRVTCTHDAALRSQLPALSKLPPRYVVWGDGTSDEMCLGLLVVGPAA